MPTHCCMSKSDQKGYKNKKEEKVPFFLSFQPTKLSEKKLLHAIERRGEGLSLNKENKDLFSSGQAHSA